MKKDPMDLAKEITRVRSRHGRSHKILLRKSHVKIAENDHGNFKHTSNFIQHLSCIINLIFINCSSRCSYQVCSIWL